MRAARLRLLALLVVPASLSAYGFQRSPARPPAPEVAKLAAESAAHSPAVLEAALAATPDQRQRVAAQAGRGRGTARPGAAGQARQAAPLTAEEQERFEAGQEIYRGICQACHQPDGRGKEKMAPSLIDSAFVVAAPEIPSRIVLQGKQGSVGLMPPLGGTLKDEQIASVLTYIRREWGHRATAVGPSTVKEVRAKTADRTRPWTDDELKELMTGSK